MTCLIGVFQSGLLILGADRKWVEWRPGHPFIYLPEHDKIIPLGAELWLGFSGAREIMERLEGHLTRHPLSVGNGLEGMRAEFGTCLGLLHQDFLDRLARDFPENDRPAALTRLTVFLGGRLPPTDDPELWVVSSRDDFVWHAIDGEHVSTAVVGPDDAVAAVAEPVLVRMWEFGNPILCVNAAIRAVSQADPQRVSPSGTVMCLSTDPRDRKLPQETDF